MINANLGSTNHLSTFSKRNKQQKLQRRIDINNITYYAEKVSLEITLSIMHN